MKSNEFTCPHCGQPIRIITVDNEGKEITGLILRLTGRFLK